MKWFPFIKTYYDKGLYTNESIATFVEANYITEDEYSEITGEDYEA